MVQKRCCQYCCIGPPLCKIYMTTGLLVLKGVERPYDVDSKMVLAIINIDILVLIDNS